MALPKHCLCVSAHVCVLCLPVSSFLLPELGRLQNYTCSACMHVQTERQKKHLPRNLQKDQDGERASGAPPPSHHLRGLWPARTSSASSPSVNPSHELAEGNLSNYSPQNPGEPWSETQILSRIRERRRRLTPSGLVFTAFPAAS